MKTVLKIYLLVIFSLIIANNTFSQCSITAKVSTIGGVPKDTVEICLGESVTLTSSGACNFLMNNNFNNGTIGTGWSSNVVASFTNPCPPTNLPASGIVCWLGQNSYPRELVTVSYDLSTGGCFINFDMKYGANQNTANCESPDLPTEGVHLQYSVNNGTTWVQFPGVDQAPSGTYGTSNYINGTGGYWTPVSGNAATGPYYQWNRYTSPIPAAASTVNTKIRWYQDIASGNAFDHWGIDNVEILCNSLQNVKWSTGHNVFNPPPITPTQTTWYVVTIMDSIQNPPLIAKDSVLVIVHPIPTSNFSVVSPVCSDYKTTLQYTGNAPLNSNFNWNIGGNPISTNGSGSGPILVQWDRPSIYGATDSIVNTISLTVKDTNNCTSLPTTMDVVVYESPSPSFETVPQPAKGCSPLTVEFKDASEPTIQSFFWDLGGGLTFNVPNFTHTFTNPGIYNAKLVVTTPYGCKDSVSISNVVEVYTQPVAGFNVTPDIAPKNDAHFVFTNTTTGATNYTWDFGDGTPFSNLMNPTHNYYQNGLYTIWMWAYTVHGCKDSISKTVRVVEDSLVFPNIITPNGDGYNDYFKITNLENYKHNKLLIFNRWGKKVYEKENYLPDTDKWDGSGLPDGTYYFVLTYEGYIRSGEHKGSLTILR
jgi:gliding motility-associated-like protein